MAQRLFLGPATPRQDATDVVAQEKHYMPGGDLYDDNGNNENEDKISRTPASLERQVCSLDPMAPKNLGRISIVGPRLRCSVGFSV